MSLPYFPMFPSDFEAKTSHLTLAEDGAYNRLLRICWMTPGCTIPTDEAWIMRRARAHTDEDKEAVRAVLSEYFSVENGRYSNAKLMRVWREANEAHEKRKNAGAKGGKAKALKTKETGPSNATAMLKQPEPEPELLKREAKASPKKKTGTRLPEQWRFPVEYGEWAVSEGWAEAAIRTEAEKFRDFWVSKPGRDATKLDWFATWRNWMRNSKTPKITAINGGQNGQFASRSEQRVSAFVGGARGAS